MTQPAEDRAAALRMIAEHPYRYPVASALPDDMPNLRAALEPDERLHRYHGVIEVIAGFASDATLWLTRPGLLALFAAIKHAAGRLEAQRRDAEERLADALVMNRELRHEIEALKCERMRESA
jgi:hypothetical protein